MMPTEARSVIATSAQWNSDTPFLFVFVVAAQRPSKVVEGCATDYYYYCCCCCCSAGSGSEGMRQLPIRL